MHIKLTLLFLALTTIDVASTTTSEADALIQSVCDKLNQTSSLKFQDDHQWEWLCQELYSFQGNPPYTDVDTDDVPLKRRLRRAARGGSSGGSRVSSGSRTSSGIRTSASASRSSSTRFRSTRTGTTYNRPSGWQWSRSRLIFLPLATRFAHRSRSSSSRYTTPTPGATDYYYCTSTDNPSVEIQCNTVNGDTQCCEETASQEAFCCGGDIPDDVLQDMNRATQTIAHVFYTIAGLALGMHFFMGRFYR